MNERTVALSAIFQAGELVRQAASHGTWSGYAASALLRSLLRLESESLRDIYGDLDRVKLGAQVLTSVLQGDRQYMDSLQYAIAILKVERRFHRAAAMQEKIGRELQRIAARERDAEAHEVEDLQAAEIAELYSQTISTLSPRIIVHGRPRHLQEERTVNWIRTLLFAGLRSAFLWEQLGGNRWRLMFGRRRILEEAEEFLAG